MKNLVLDHNSYRIFTNSRASTKFLTELYKQKILKNHDYKVKYLKQDVEQALRVHVHYSLRSKWCIASSKVLIFLLWVKCVFICS